MTAIHHDLARILALLPGPSSRKARQLGVTQTALSEWLRIARGDVVRPHNRAPTEGDVERARKLLAEHRKLVNEETTHDPSRTTEP